MRPIDGDKLVEMLGAVNLNASGRASLEAYELAIQIAKGLPRVKAPSSLCWESYSDFIMCPICGTEFPYSIVTCLGNPFKHCPECGTPLVGCDTPREEEPFEI